MIDLCMKAGSFIYVVLCSQNYLLLDLLQKTKKQKQRQKQDITFKFRQGTTHVGSSYLLTKHDTIAVKDTLVKEFPVVRLTPRTCQASYAQTYHHRRSFSSAKGRRANRPTRQKLARRQGKPMRISTWGHGCQRPCPGGFCLRIDQSG
ncbi:hypothetical protein HZ326_0076 [Fusarium oxysporum f. sp. albedinis]|nr:hypothetical protein HZ326_0076 [Fusarium oxysporum f. sp. albedinis]